MKTDETGQATSESGPEDAAEAEPAAAGANPLAKVPAVGTEIEAGRVVTGAKADAGGAWLQINGGPDWLPYQPAA